MTKYSGALLYKALETKYKAEKAEAKANLEVFFEHKVAVADHPNVVESMEKLIKKYTSDSEKLEILQEDF